MQIQDPSSNSHLNDNIEDKFHELIDNIYRQGEMIERIHKTSGFNNYQVALVKLNIFQNNNFYSSLN